MQQVDVYTSMADAAYQGAPGAYSEEAAQRLLGTDARLMPCTTLEQTFDAASDGRASHAVVPIENAVSGTVAGVYELLLSHNLQVTGEVSIKLDHVLVAPAGTVFKDVRRVMSHPFALAQCGDFFRAHKGIEAVSVFDTAGAVRMVVEATDGATAAIASRRAARLYGATIIRERFQDDPDNWTRFVCLTAAGPEIPRTTGLKAVLACGLKHQPGTLAAALQALANRGLSVTKIEGRPDRGRPFEYRFVVELVPGDGHPIDAAVFAVLSPCTEWVKVLGIYTPTDADTTSRQNPT